jgi:16S rRNA (adenine1518-N6/adenine1519-N6)-dimethyltransferase
MDLFSMTEIRRLLDRHGFSFRKSLGQNFITERWVPERIVSESGIDSRFGVVEIGPGIGTLTQFLCKYAGKVAAVEIDSRLLPVLEETLAGCNNFRLYHADVLKTDLAAIVKNDLDKLIPAACANLPYYITSPVLERLLKGRLFRQVTVMVQKEVARRICAKPVSSEYGSLSVFSSFYSEPKILFDVSAGCFMPRPKVDSSVVLFRMRGENPYGVCDEELFFRIVSASFSQRRKTLANGLSSALPVEKDALKKLIEGCGFSPDVRGETLSVEDFAKLTAAAGKILV